MQTLEEAFGPAGLLSSHLPSFTYREPQQRMAVLVGEALRERRHAVLEAGTGIGKTYAYVVPVLLSGRRAIISTGTRTLQDQLFTRDLPALGRALGRPVEVALLKGRSNYLCLHRLELARAGGDSSTPERRGTLDALADWGKTTQTGDLTELDDLGDEHALRALVSSTTENCLGNRCEHFDECFVVDARRRAQAAEVVIVNHHLLLADLALKEAGFGELLPDADAVIVDEAHLLPEIAQQFFDTCVTSREIELLGRDALAESRVAGEAEELSAATRALLNAALDARAGAYGAMGRMAWAAGPTRLRDALAELAAPLASLTRALAVVASTPGLERVRERCVALAERLAAVLVADDDEGLKWLEITERGFGAHFTPLDVGKALAERIDAQGGAWVLTSATLAVGDDFSHFVDRVGIAAPVREVLPSPFDYSRNARLYLPDGLPPPGEPEHTAALLDCVQPLIEASKGGAFLLFTSYRALHRAREWIESAFLPGTLLLVQGEGPRSQLLEEFRRDGNAVLLGTGSFWQGVDVRGPALRLVVIDKLPFAVPSDPMVQARSQALRRVGADPFAAYQLPQAVIALKQGVGRLIRDYDDRGLIVLGDPRLRTRSYGRLFLDSLPPMPLLDGHHDAIAYAASLGPAASRRRKRRAGR